MDIPCIKNIALEVERWPNFVAVATHSQNQWDDSFVIRALIAFVCVRLTVLLSFIGFCQIQGKSVTTILQRWDAQWYLRIARNGYGSTSISLDGRHLSDYAFFPFFPLLERGVSKISLLAIVNSGILISVVSSGFAAIGIFKSAEYIYDSRIAFFTTVLWAAIPVGIVEWLSYSESLFTACAAWSLYFLLKRKWIAAGVLAAAAGFSRPIGVAIALAVVISSLLPNQESKLNWRRIAAAVIAPLGSLGYLAWVALKLRNPLAYFDITKQWHNSFDGGHSFLNWIIHLITGANFPDILSGTIVILGIFLIFFLFWHAIKDHQPLPLLVYTGIIIILSLTTSGYFGSKPRYLLPAFPLLLPLAKSLSERSLKVTNVILLLFTLIAGAYGAIWLTGTGPL